MTSFRHVTVLRDEAATLLAASTGRRVLDGTLGGGGHSEALLERGATVIGLDQDERALAAARERLAKYGDRFTAVHANFRDARKVLDSLGIDTVDGTMVDLGVSSPQLDEAARGFSFQNAGPLDMRMDTSQGQRLSELLANADVRDLMRILQDYGEEKLARRFAQAIVRAREEGRLTDTKALADVIAEATPAKMWPRGIHPATRSFQGLRIAVNDELGALEAWLAALPSLLGPGGRACAIAFHSLEDRPVKKRFAELTTGCICPPDLPICGCGRTAGWRLVTRKPVKATEAEVAENPRSRSAHLRCVERIAA
jgi:16S rRNA (cytosine1402-N4)-methyltransferase